MRQVVLDTESTGLEVSGGHRIIEIGCVELLDRRLTGRHYHEYLNPGRAIDAGAEAVHGISLDFLADKPAFESIKDAFLSFIDGAELVIHNADFDLGFLDQELKLVREAKKTRQRCSIVDSLALARTRFPGQKNNLDALCKRLGVDNSGRSLHGALLDAQILAEVYLALTGGQGSLSLESHLAGHETLNTADVGQKGSRPRGPLPLVAVSQAEQEAHESMLALLRSESESGCVWDDLERSPTDGGQ